MAINFDSRPAGMSKREYAASILGGSKEDYDNSGNKKSSGGSSSSSSLSSSSYKPKSYDYKDFVDTKSVSNSYDSAKNVFTDQLTALKPRYEELYKQLQASEDLAAEKEAQLSANESTQQKNDLAKRGVSTDTSNSYYNTEAGKLQAQQAIRSKETALDFAGKRLDISGAQSADERDINTSIANLDLSKASTISSMITDAKKTAAGLNEQEADRALQNSQWEKTFAYTKSKDAADRSLELYKLSKAESTSNDNAFNSTVASLVSTAYSTSNPAPYTRERIQKQLEAAFPKQGSAIKAAMAKFFPDGWESQAAGAVNISKGNDGETYINY